MSAAYIRLIFRGRTIIFTFLFAYPFLISGFIVILIIYFENLVKFVLVILHRIVFFRLIHNFLTFSIPVSDCFLWILIVLLHFREDLISTHKRACLDIMHLIAIPDIWISLLRIDHAIIIHRNNKGSYHTVI